MSTATTSSSDDFVTEHDDDLKKILLPYGLAILAQVPMLLLYFMGLWEQAHYQFFPFAVLATAGLAWMRWPRESAMPFHRSLASDILLVLGFLAALMGVALVDPWYAALSIFLIVTSLFARTQDTETGKSLWTCALPLFVCLYLPNRYDTVIITRLQAYSAQFTSKLLDLIGLGHHLDGVVINVPGGKQYGIEAACSGVVSFFTLLAVTMVFIVWARRITTPRPAIAWMLIGTGFVLAMVDSAIGGFGWLALGGMALILMGIVGFRSSVLLLSAVFWALFMNTVRILLIPVSEVQLGFDIAHGIPHAILGYVVLIIGILLVLSTDQFLTFLFGAVEEPDSGASDFQKPITSFWNGFLWGGKTTEDGRSSSRKKKAKVRQPVSQTGRSLIWTIAGIMIVAGLWQLWDVRQSYAHQGDGLTVRVFDTDVTMDYEKGDMPELVGGDWKQFYYESQDRESSSDFGQRSDVWQFQAPRCQAVASLDQSFPGWHELTTCYKNQGWNLVSRTWHEGEPVQEGGEPWAYIEARFSKNTGEQGYLLFSHFDAFGQPVEAPAHWGSLNSFFIRVKNRFGNRIRATLFDGAVYQTQVWLQAYQPFEDSLKEEAQQRYLEMREHLREKFMEKRTAESE